MASDSMWRTSLTKAAMSAVDMVWHTAAKLWRRAYRKVATVAVGHSLLRASCGPIAEAPNSDTTGGAWVGMNSVVSAASSKGMRDHNWKTHLVTSGFH